MTGRQARSRHPKLPLRSGLSTHSPGRKTTCRPEIKREVATFGRFTRHKDVRPFVPAAFALLVLSCACQNQYTIIRSAGEALASPIMVDGNAPTPARGYVSPAGQLEAKLRIVAPDSFAGLAIDGDRSVVVYTTVVEPALTTAIAEVQASTPGGLTVRLVSGLNNSLATLERVRDQITGRHRELAAAGVNLTQWGADIIANRVRIGVHGLTPKISADLAQEFGADRILVMEGEYFRTT